MSEPLPTNFSRVDAGFFFHLRYFDLDNEKGIENPIVVKPEYIVLAENLAQKNGVPSFIFGERIEGRIVLEILGAGEEPALKNAEMLMQVYCIAQN
jgi:hypothetical protein